jgi:cell division transport system permease protein
VKKPRLSLLRRAFSQMREDLWLQFVAVTSLSLCLFIMGMALICHHALDGLLERVSTGAGLRLVLAASLSPDDGARLAERLSLWPEIRESGYVSSQQALELLSARLGQKYDDLLAGLNANPLPAVVELQLASGADIKALIARLEQTPGVEEIVEARPWLERLEKLRYLLQKVIMGMAVILFAALALVAANISRLAVYTRREMLVILDLLGAGGFYLRAPFMVEATAQAALGVGLSSAALLLSLRLLPAYAPPWLLPLIPPDLPLYIPLSLLVMAALAGLLGSLLGVGRALRPPRLA